jgi:hypothetical protein
VYGPIARKSTIGMFKTTDYIGAGKDVLVCQLTSGFFAK